MRGAMMATRSSDGVRCLVAGALPDGYVRVAKAGRPPRASKLTPAQEATGNRHPDDEGRVAARQHLREALLQKGAKALKGKQLFPHEIVQKCMQGRAPLSTLEADLMHAQWEALLEGVREAMAAAAAAREAAVAEAAGGAAAGLEAVATLRAALPKPIDVSVDYLRPGKPLDVYARGTITRQGSRVANVRVEAWQERRGAPVAALHGHFLIKPAGDRQALTPK